MQVRINYFTGERLYRAVQREVKLALKKVGCLPTPLPPSSSSSSFFFFSFAF